MLRNLSSYGGCDMPAVTPYADVAYSPTTGDPVPVPSDCTKGL